MLHVKFQMSPLSGGWPPIGSREAKSTKSGVDSAKSKVDSAGPMHPWAESLHQNRLREKGARQSRADASTGKAR